ncbi:hypothetical protein BDL97_14G016900 [Sphagnum fallax]|nr:hypothetical protein BDL97_14G016900 [Sphagnum fallax]
MATAMTAGGATAAACTTGLQQAGRTCINGMHSSSATPRSSSSLSSNFLCTRSLQSGPIMRNNTMRASFRPSLLVARAAAKLPTGVEPPKEEPKLPILFWGFTENAEVWNSRAAMIGLFGIIAVEAIINKGILQLLGIEIGKGLDLPL